MHWYAQPMFHWPPLTVNGVLVQAPFDCMGPSRTEMVPAGVDVDVDVGDAPPAAVVVVALAGAVVVAAPPGAVVVEAPAPPTVLVPPAGDAAGGNL